MKNLDTNFARTGIINRGDVAPKGTKIGWGRLDIAMVCDPPKLNITHQHKHNISLVSKFHKGREIIWKPMSEKFPWGRYNDLERKQRTENGVLSI